MEFTLKNIRAWLDEQDDTMLVKLWNEVCRCCIHGYDWSDHIEPMPHNTRKLLQYLMGCYGEDAFDIVYSTGQLPYYNDENMHFNISEKWFVLRYGVLLSFNDIRSFHINSSAIDFDDLARAIYDYHDCRDVNFHAVDDYFDFEDEEE